MVDSDSLNDFLGKNLIQNAKEEHERAKRKLEEIRQRMKDELTGVKQDEDSLQDLARDIIEAKDRDQPEFRKLLKGGGFGWDRE